MGRRAMMDPRTEWESMWELMDRMADEGWGRRGLGPARRGARAPVAGRRLRDAERAGHPGAPYPG